MSNLKTGLAECVRLCAGKNAIERLCLGIEWEQPLNQRTMAELSALSQEITDLPRRIEFRSSEKLVEEATQGRESLSFEEESELVEIVLDNRQSAEDSKDDKTLEIKISSQGFFFQLLASTYISWTDTKQKAASLTSTLLNRILEERPVNSVGLQVIDSLSFDRNLDFSEILDEKSEYLPKAVFSKHAYWRVDQSYYEADDHATAALTNFQIVHTPKDEGYDNLVIACLHRADLVEATKLSSEDMYQRYDALYRMNKSLVSSLLSEKLGKLIGIIKEGDSYGS